MLPSLFLRLSIDTAFKDEMLPILFKDTLHYGNNRSPSVDNVSARTKKEPTQCKPKDTVLKRGRSPSPSTKRLLTCTLSGTTYRNNPDVWMALARDLATEMFLDDLVLLGVTVHMDLRVDESFKHVATLLYTSDEDCLGQINRTLTFLGDFLTEERNGQTVTWKLFDKVCVGALPPPPQKKKIGRI